MKEKAMDIATDALIRAEQSRNQMAAWVMLANAAGLFAVLTTMWAVEAPMLPTFSRWIAAAYLAGMALGFASRFYATELCNAVARGAMHTVTNTEPPKEIRVTRYEALSIVLWVLSAAVFAGTTAVIIVAAPVGL